MTPWTVVHQAPPSMGFSRQEYWGGLPFLSPGDLPNPGTEIRSPALQADSKLDQGLSQIFFVHVSTSLLPTGMPSPVTSLTNHPHFPVWVRAHPCHGAALSSPCSGPREPGQLSQSFDVRSSSALWVGKGRNVNK